MIILERLPRGYREATERLPRGYREATERLPRGYREAIEIIFDIYITFVMSIKYTRCF
jgi:hypothetical protein